MGASSERRRAVVLVGLLAARGSAMSLVAPRVLEQIERINAFKVSLLPTEIWRHGRGGAVGRGDQRARSRGVPPLESSGQFVSARHKSILGAAALPVEVEEPAAYLPIDVVRSRIRGDFLERQYYTTGRLSREVYAERCFFDSPDFDMPVRSSAAFSSALRGLFDARTSKLDLLDLREGADPSRAFVAEWRLEGRLKLPWRPSIKPFVGRTVFETDHRTGLVTRHVEEWSLSALDAFASTLLPDLLGPNLGFAPPAPDVETLLASARPPAPGISLEDRFPALKHAANGPPTTAASLEDDEG